MQYRVFSVPLFGTEESTEELNHFLRAHKIIDVKRELAQSNGMAMWTFCVAYMTDRNGMSEGVPHGAKREKVDYKEILSPEAFSRFVRMRKYRKMLAEADAVPAYAVFTDAELAAMSSLDVLDAKGIMSIPGIGKKKVEKYGQAFCQQDFSKDEEGGIPDGENS